MYIELKWYKNDSKSYSIIFINEIDNELIDAIKL